MLHIKEIKVAISNVKAIADIDIDEGILKALEVYQLVKECDEISVLADLCKFIGTLYLKNGKYLEAKEIYLEAIKHYTTEKNFQEIGNIYNNLIIIAFSLDQHDLIEKYKDLAIHFYFNIDDNSGAISVLNNLAVYYLGVKQHEKAIKTFEDILVQYKSKLTNKECLGIKANLNRCKLSSGKNINEALSELEVILEEAKEIEHTYVIGLVYMFFAEYYESIEDYKKTCYYLKLRYKYSNQIKADDFSHHIQTHMNNLSDSINELELKEAKLKNQELAEKHAKVSQRNGLLEALLETIPLPFYHTDTEGNIIGCNKTLLSYANLNFKDIYNKRFCDVLNTDIDEFEKYLKKVLSIKKPLISERKLIINGEESHFDVYENLFYGSDNKVAGIVNIFNDVTEQKKLQIELKDSKDKLEAIFDNAQIGILVLDTELNFTFINPYIIKHLGYTEQHIKQQGMNLLKNRCTNLVEAIHSNFEKGLQHEPVESCIETNHGNIIYIRTEATKLFDDDGNVTSYLLIIKNITEEKKNKLEVQHINAHLKSIMESASNVYIASLDRERRFTYFNQNYYNSVKEKLGISMKVGDEYYRKFQTKKDIDSTRKFLERVFNGEHISGTKHYSASKGFKEQFVQYYFSPIIDDNKDIIGATLFSYDITDRILAQLQLALANSTKDKFFSIIAHDLRSPIGNIKALLEYIIADDKLTHAELMQMLSHLTDTAINTFDLLENLLKWASNQKGSLSIIPEQTRLKSVLESVLKLTINLAANKDIRIIADIPNEAQAYIDKDMITTVVRNLISNAIKYTPKKGKITIAVTQDSYYCTVKITDTGVGIKKEVIPFLTQFDRTISTYGTEGEKGSGLGIVLSNELIQKMHGKFWIESEEGVGSTFSFTVPTDISSY